MCNACQYNIAMNLMASLFTSFFLFLLPQSTSISGNLQTDVLKKILISFLNLFCFFLKEKFLATDFLGEWDDMWPWIDLSKVSIKEVQKLLWE